MPDIKVYQHINSQPTHRKTPLSFFKDIGLLELTEYVITLLLCKTSLLGVMSPLGLAYFGATLLRQRTPLNILFAVCGALLAGSGIISFKYIGAVVVFSVCALILKKDLCDKPYFLAGLSSFSLFANGMMYLMFKGFMVYDFMLLLIECILTFGSFLAFHKGTALLRNIKDRTVFENDEVLSLVILAGSVILSISTIPYLRSIAHIASIYIILTLSLYANFGVAAAAGVVLGVINSMGDVMSTSVIGVYAFCGLTAGLCRKWGKWGVCISFLLSNAAIMLYLNNSTDRIITVVYIAAASSLFFATPDKLLGKLGCVVRTVQPIPDSVAATDRINQKLSAVSHSFLNLADVFSNLAQYRVNADMKDVSVIFDRTAQEVCASCSMNTHCWQQEFNNSYQQLLSAFEEIEQKGVVSKNCFPQRFVDKCIRIDPFIEAYSKQYELYQADLCWAGKVLESRELIAEQFKNVSRIMDHLKDELTEDVTFDEQLAQKVHSALDQHGIRAHDISVVCGDGYEVHFRMKSCGGNLKCGAVAAGIISECIGAPMIRTGNTCGEQECDIVFKEQLKYRLEIGLARTKREGQKQSGDNYTFMALDDTRYLLALSDGMGSGKHARLQSTVTINLVEKLLEAGFDKDTAIKLINSVLMLRSDKESFATMDLCVSNLYNGKLDFIKIGAATTFIRREAGVERIESTSLPVGIVNAVDADYSTRYVRGGDFIIMVTDGVTDCEEHRIKNHGALEDIISKYHGANPQELADHLLKSALAMSGGIAEDDMTILVAQVREIF